MNSGKCHRVFLIGGEAGRCEYGMLGRVSAWQPIWEQKYPLNLHDLNSNQSIGNLNTEKFLHFWYYTWSLAIRTEIGFVKSTVSLINLEHCCCIQSSFCLGAVWTVNTLLAYLVHFAAAILNFGTIWLRPLRDMLKSCWLSCGKALSMASAYLINKQMCQEYCKVH